MGRVQRLPLLDGASVFAPDVLWGKLNVEQSSSDLRMPRQPLQGGQGHAGAYHIRPERMSQPVWIGMRDSTANSMMAEWRAKSGRTHRVGARPAFQGVEQVGRVG